MQAAFTRFARNRPALLGAVILLLVLVTAVAAPLLYPAGAFALAGPPLQPPGGKFLLGTDTLGRDVAAGIVYGARTSLMIGVSATLVAVFLGVAFGAVAGYYRGSLDTALMRITELCQTIPSFILAILLVAILSPSVNNEILAIAIVSWPGIARLARGEFAAVGGREFVLALWGVGGGGDAIAL